MIKYLGLDLGGTNIKVSFLGVDGSRLTQLSEETFSTEGSLGPDHVVENIVSIIKQYREEHDGIAAIGMTFPGIFDHQTGNTLVVPNIPGDWKNYPFKRNIEMGSGATISMINDARAFAFAESLLGAARGKATVACLTLGTGIGGGVVINGEVLMGATLGAGEIGHQIVLKDGPQCGCGQRGCVEALTAGPAIVKKSGKRTPLEAYEAALAGDQQSIDTFKEVSEWLGIACSNLVAVLSPDVIVIGGGIAQAGEYLMDLIRSETKRQVKLFPESAVNIVTAELGVYAGAMGAALYGATMAGATLSFTSIT